ncbi:MAG: hypothetical protein GX579_08460 [Chloroflexi bacterium]|nr:hypothetical protein [Chloroflexota bacterium]
MGRSPGRIIAILLALAGLGLILVYVAILPERRQREEPVGVASPAATPLPTATETVAPAAIPPTRALADASELPLAYRDRFGVTGKPEDVLMAADIGLPFGSFSTWLMHLDPVIPPGAFLWQMIRVSEEGPRPSRAEIEAAIDSAPGAAWIIGNEPDVIHQDNVTPQRYAEIYHELYVLIKQRDPSALVAIGGVTQPTPLRRAYLDAVLDGYEARYGAPMPVDVWNVHAFILREERDSWGVDIPPGMDDELAIRYEIGDHLDMEIFRQLIFDFRAWMAERGYGDRPLLVSEYGMLMPYEYGFTEAQVAGFMTATFDFFLKTRGPTGYPADDNRLVQWWQWFVVDDDEHEEWRPTFLVDRESRTLTPLGETFASYVRNLDHEP